jgi:hypothetical protein
VIGGWWLVADVNLIIDIINQTDQLKVVVFVVAALVVAVSLIYLEANRVNLVESGKCGHHIRQASTASAVTRLTGSRFQVPGCR